MSDFESMHGQGPDADDDGAGRSLGRDAAGLGLFAVATLLGVSVLMSVTRPAEDPRGTTAFFTALCDLLGSWPLLALALALAFLGGRLWVAGDAGGLPRHLAGALGITLALSVLASAAWAGLGGTFGDGTGGWVSGLATPFAGVPLALALLGGVVWVAWLREPGTRTQAPTVQDLAPRRIPAADSGGLSPDEAAALLPLKGGQTRSDGPQAGLLESQGGDEGTEIEPPRVTGRSIPIAPDLKPLYPPDVRLQGGIPEGTRPLESRDQAQSLRPRSQARVAEPQLRPPEQPVRAEREALGSAATAAPVQRAPESNPPAPERSAVADLAPAELRRDSSAGLLSRPGADLTRAPRAAPEARPLAASIAPEPPSWESPDEELDEGDEQAGAEGPALGLGPSVDLDDGEESELESDQEDGEDDANALGDDGEAVEVETADEGADGEAGEDDELDDLDEDAADEERELDEEQTAELEPTEASALPRPGWEQPGLFDEVPVDAYGTPRALVDELRRANEAAAHRLVTTELTEEDEDVPAAKALEAAAPSEAEAGRGRGIAQDEVVSEPDGAEPEVILEPQRAARPSRTKSRRSPAKADAPAERPDPEHDLLYRAGALFIERGRVAVSMLQRDFQLDFKQATALLDQLQQAGLIGPYLGGQRRDILLTLEEWRERRIGTA